MPKQERDHSHQTGFACEICEAREFSCERLDDYVNGYNYAIESCAAALEKAAIGSKLTSNEKMLLVDWAKKFRVKKK